MFRVVQSGFRFIRGQGLGLVLFSVSAVGLLLEISGATPHVHMLEDMGLQQSIG